MDVLFSDAATGLAVHPMLGGSPAPASRSRMKAISRCYEIDGETVWMPALVHMAVSPMT